MRVAVRIGRIERYRHDRSDICHIGATGDEGLGNGGTTCRILGYTSLYHHGLRGGSRGVGVISGRGDCRNGSSVVIGPSQGATANGVIVSCSPDSIVQQIGKSVV